MRTVTLESAIAATAKMGLRNPYSPRKGWRSIGTSRGPAKWVEDACGNRDQEHVVGKGPEQVLLDVSNSGFTEIYGLRHPAHVCADERGLLTSCHPFHQQRNGMLVQSVCNSTEQPKVRRRLEE
jgi:hypothetical protein